MSGKGTRRRAAARPGGDRTVLWRRWSAKAEKRFFAALARTRNARAAAEAAGFSAGTVYNLKRSRPDFASRWAATLAAAPRRASGTIVRYARGGHAQRVRCHRQWSEDVEALFLDVLAATANISLAAAEAGVGRTSVYRQRRLRADFAEKWQGALEQGYARLEMSLVRAANAALAGVDHDGERPLPAMTIDQAIRLLQLHRASVTGLGRRPGWKGGPSRGVDHYRASILRKLEAIRNARRPRGDEGEEGGGDGEGR
ncbi:MAG TPA: hypothetical protein VFZ91_01390 [Allosphingosinicella sp.]